MYNEWPALSVLLESYIRAAEADASNVSSSSYQTITLKRYRKTFSSI